MKTPETIAEALLRGDAAVIDRLAAGLLVPRRDNFVERPWAGTSMRGYKRCHAPLERPLSAGSGLGEAFEIAAFDEDEEAARYPSLIEFADGSRLPLPRLLDVHADALLGSDFVARHGARFPLLPKTLNVRELLSVQGHPPGNTEVYIIIDATPGATLRLGFKADMDPVVLEQELETGLERQRALAALLDPDADAHVFQARMAGWLADREAGIEDAADWLGDFLRPDAADPRGLAAELKALYWQVLDSMNAIAVEPGQVIHNATPARYLEPGQPASAEVHALGNPEGLEFLALEIRRPGPTFRAWDNVRFPQRPVNVAAAVRALNLRATSPADFIVEPEPVAGRAGVFRSIDSPAFRVEHFRPAPGKAIELPAGAPATLHVLEGGILVTPLGEPGAARLLARGESALVPAGAGGCRIEAEGPAHAICVTLPE